MLFDAPLAIDNLIAAHRQTSLAKLADAGPKELWASVRKVAGQQSTPNLHLCDIDSINAYFAKVATNCNYDRSAVMKHFTPDADISDVPSLTEF